MRVLVEVLSDKDIMNWEDILAPGRALIYKTLRTVNPKLAAELHDHGYKNTGMKPVSYSAPTFESTKSGTKKYCTQGEGYIAFASPLDEVSRALLRGLLDTRQITWGQSILTVQDVLFEASHDQDLHLWQTSTPVVVLSKERRFLLPEDKGYEQALTHNLRHKADVLGLDNDLQVEIVDAGARRMMGVGKDRRIGARVTARIHGQEITLGSLRDWGLGQSNIAGFGWVQ